MNTVQKGPKRPLAPYAPLCYPKQPAKHTLGLFRPPDQTQRFQMAQASTLPGISSDDLARPLTRANLLDLLSKGTGNEELVMEDEETGYFLAITNIYFKDGKIVFFAD